MRYVRIIVVALMLAVTALHGKPAYAQTGDVQVRVDMQGDRGFVIFIKQIDAKGIVTKQVINSQKPAVDFYIGRNERRIQTTISCGFVPGGNVLFDGVIQIPENTDSALIRGSLHLSKLIVAIGNDMVMLPLRTNWC